MTVAPRDVDRLRELGYLVRAVKGPDGGYQLDAGTTHQWRSGTPGAGLFARSATPPAS